MKSPAPTVADAAEAPEAEAAEAITDEAVAEQEPVTPPAIVATVSDGGPAPSALTHVVLRPFVGCGLDRVIGEVVDASTWRMVDTLVDGRRLRPLTRQDPEPVPDGQGRYFIDDDTLLAYIDSIVPSDIEEN